MSVNYIDQITDTAGTTHYIAEGVDTRIFTAKCTTAAATADKVATLDDATGFSLTAGVKVAVTFSYSNTATTPTLNVNNTGAKTIAIPSSTDAYTTGNGTTYNTWGAYESILFTYTGTYWVHIPSGYLGYLAYNTASGRQAKITASGILKGDGSGGVTAATAGTDYPPVNHAATATTYGVGNNSNYGHVKLSDSTSSTSSTTDGIAATPAAVKAAYDLANGKQASITTSGILKGNGSGTISAAVADTDYVSLTGLNTKLNRNSAVTAAAANASGTEDTTTNTLYMVRGEAFNTTETTPTYNGQICWTIE